MRNIANKRVDIFPLRKKNNEIAKLLMKSYEEL